MELLASHIEKSKAPKGIWEFSPKSNSIDQMNGGAFYFIGAL